MPTLLSEAEIHNFRARLCAEAERQFLRSGVDAVSMRSLAKALGCSPTTPYTYFKNKGEILALVRASILNRLCEKLEKTECEDARLWTQAHLKACVDFAFNEPESYRLIFDMYQSDEDEHPELVRANARTLHVNYGYVEKLIEQGHLEGDAQELGYMFFAELHGLIVLRMTGRPRTTREQFDKKCQDYFSWITRGLRPTRAAAAAPTTTAAKTAVEPPSSKRRATPAAR